MIVPWKFLQEILKPGNSSGTVASTKINIHMNNTLESKELTINEEICHEKVLNPTLFNLIVEAMTKEIIAEIRNLRVEGMNFCKQPHTLLETKLKEKKQ